MVECRRYWMQPRIRGILTAMAEIGQAAVFESPHPLADGYNSRSASRRRGREGLRRAKEGRMHAGSLHWAKRLVPPVSPEIRPGMAGHTGGSGMAPGALA